MRGRDKYCITVSGTTNSEIWHEIRNVFGPTPSTVSGTDVILNEDIAEYNDWVNEYGNVPFDKWLIWKLRVGTKRYGNLPENKKHINKIGHIWSPCPYSTQSSDLNTRLRLGLGKLDPLPAKVDHTLGGITYYMEMSSRGARWGFECNCPSCTYLLLYGRKYFYV